MNFSFSEMVFLFFLALIIFGPKKLPEIGRQVGKALAEFKRASNEFKAQLETEMRQIELEETVRKEKEKEAQSPSTLPNVSGVGENSVDALGVPDPLSHPYAADTSLADSAPEAQTPSEMALGVPAVSPESIGAASNVEPVASSEPPAAAEPEMQSIPRSDNFTAHDLSAPAASPLPEEPMLAEDAVVASVGEKSPKSDHALKGSDA